jgi:hypothetical protein
MTVGSNKKKLKRITLPIINEGAALTGIYDVLTPTA